MNAKLTIDDKSEGGYRYESQMADIYQMFLILTRSLVDRPEEIEITLVPDDSGGVVLQIRSNPVDTGKLIGNNGRTAKALRIILDANAKKMKCHLRLDIISMKQYATEASKILTV